MDLLSRNNTKKMGVELQDAADQINSLYVTIENAYMQTAELLYKAHEEHFPHGNYKEFIRWAVDATPYSESNINNFIRVYEMFGLNHTSGVIKENAIPFNTLVELTKQGVQKTHVNEILRKYKNKNSENRPTV